MDEKGSIAMRRLSVLIFFLSVSGYASAATTVATADSYNATAWFTSGLLDGKPVDRIDSAHLDQDSIVLYVDWEKMRLRAYRTEVRIVDPNGQVVGKIRNTILPGSGSYYTYYYYRPSPEDTPGDWTYQVYVDGRNAFEARIPVLAGQARK